MSQVMGFGFPAGDRLRCDNPLCDEYAQHMCKVPGTDGDREIFGCDTHIDQLITGQRMLSRVKLRKPGERNAT